MASLISSGTTEANAEFTVAAGVPVTVFLHDADGGALPSDAKAVIQLKSSSSQYRNVVGGDLHPSRPELVIAGPGDYRVVKFASTVAYGVDKA